MPERITLRDLQRALERVIDKHPDEHDARSDLERLAESNGLRFNTVRRAYKVVRALRAERTVKT